MSCETCWEREALSAPEACFIVDSDSALKK